MDTAAVLGFEFFFQDVEHTDASHVELCEFRIGRCSSAVKPSMFSPDMRHNTRAARGDV